MKKSILLPLTTALLLFSNYSMSDEEEDKAKSFLSFDIPKGLTLSLSEEDSKGTVGASFVKADNIYGLSLTGKLKDNNGEFVGLDGIDSNTKVTGTWSHFIAGLGSVSPPTSLTFDENSTALARFTLRECELLNIAIMAEGDTPIDDCSNEKVLSQKLSSGTSFNSEEALAVSRLAHEINKKCSVYVKKPWAKKLKVKEMCESTKSIESTLNHGTTNNNYALTSYGVISLSASYFQSEFEWLNIDNLGSSNSTSDTTKDGFDVSFSYAEIDATNLFKWEVGSKYEKGYSNTSANVERELCFDFESNDQITECTKGYLYPPVQTEAISPFIKLTKQLGEEQLINSIGLDIKYTFEDKEDQQGKDIGLDRWTVELPVHLVTLLDKKISAGFKLSWVSEVNKNEDPIKFVLFVSAPLTIF